MNSPLRLQLHKAFLILLGIAFVCTVWLPFMPSHTDGLELPFRFAGTGIAIAFYLVLAYCCLLPIDKPGLRGFSLAGVAVCLLSLCYTLYQTWFSDGGSYNFLMGIYGMLGAAKLYALFSVFSISFALCGILLRLDVRTAAVRNMRNVTIGAIALVVLIILMMLLAADTNEYVLRFTGLAYIVALFGIIATLYMHEVSRGLPEDSWPGVPEPLPDIAPEEESEPMT